MDIREVFARNIRAYRKKAGISQEKLGQMCGLHRTYIGGIEQLNRNVSLKNVGKIADALGVNPMLLFIEYDGKGRPVFDAGDTDNNVLVEEDLDENLDDRDPANCALAMWTNGVLELVPLSSEETDLSAQVLSNLVKLGYDDESLIDKYHEIWPQIKFLYGIH